MCEARSLKDAFYKTVQTSVFLTTNGEIFRGRLDVVSVRDLLRNVLTFLLNVASKNP